MERFWKQVNKTENGCWEWTGRTAKGYGRIEWGREQLAHRISWILHYGAIPDGLCVLHSCDNPPCVRPDHLFLGTRIDNSLDRDQKGRGRGGAPTGARNGSAKLDEADVMNIRQRHRATNITIAELAKEYGVSKTAMRMLVRGITWTHVQDGAPQLVAVSGD